MSLKKQYLKSKPICKVTFKIPEIISDSAKTASIVGEFNNWSYNANPMKRLKNGAFSVTLDLEKGREYQFRYFIDDEKWENERDADRFVPSPYLDSENSVVAV